MADDPNQHGQAPVRPGRAASVVQIAELAGGLAHELRNPLSTMMINLKLLAEDLQDQAARPEDARRRALLKVQGLTREAQRLQSLFDEFLSLAGPCQPQRVATDLNEVIGRLATFLEPEARRHQVDVTVRSAPAPLTCPVDEPLLRQALLNIAINAQQAMPEGGTLHVETRIDGCEAVITVSDTGVGIEEKDRERIFKPFFSTKPGGTGLGLSITRRLIEAHGGRLHCDSQVDRGTRFTIRLPLCPASEHSGEAAG